MRMEKDSESAWSTWGVTMLNKYDVGEREHSLHVEKLALRLFDALRNVYGFTEADRGLLRFAALAHDTGHYIDGRKHHRHSSYLVSSDVSLDDMPNRTREEAAWLVLNHRKRKLLEPERWSGHRLTRLCRLALLLRISDVLDYEHEQGAAIVEVTYSASLDRVEIKTNGFPAAKYEDKFRRKTSFASLMRLGEFRLREGERPVSNGT
ncbi:HD domain-containing protein [Paenibacillus sp. TRM 82003]|nr:HD domain-containing protein [Paenibacillus sp. TRM 82003]